MHLKNVVYLSRPLHTRANFIDNYKCRGKQCGLLCEKYDLGLHCLTKMLLKHFTRRQKQTSFEVNGVLKVNNLKSMNCKVLDFKLKGLAPSSPHHRFSSLTSGLEHLLKDVRYVTWHKNERGNSLDVRYDISGKKLFLTRFPTNL